MAKQWYMAVGGQQVGPVSEDEIRQNLANGTIDAATLLFAEGMSTWTAMRDVPEFRCAIGFVEGAKQTLADIRRRGEWRKTDGDELYDRMIKEAQSIGLEPVAL